MIRTRSLPYRLAQPARVAGDDWKMVAGGQYQPLPESIEGWDASKNLHLVRDVTIDHAGIREDCQLDPACSLRLAVTWFSPDTFARGRASLVDLGPQAPQAHPFRLTLRGSEVGSRATVQTSVVLAEPRPAGPLAPRRAGTVLWTDSRELDLDGKGARFPMESLSFKGWDLPEDAAWRLEWWDDDLEAPVLGSLRLLLNRDHPAHAHIEGPATSPDARLIREVMRFDVGRQLICRALTAEGFAEREERYPARSIGETVTRLIRTAFPRRERLLLQKELEENPILFEARLQAGLRFLKTTGSA